MTPYSVLARKRAGQHLDEAAIRSLVTGACDGTWSDAQLGAFLMAAAIRGLDLEETLTLTRAMLESGEQWQLHREVPRLGDKHSTGGVGDKVSLILAPLLAACGLPTVMLTGRGLGHTGGTADKLEAIPGLHLGLDRRGTLEQIRRCGFAIGMPTAQIAPADGRLYALRDVTATVDSLPLITASILSKKLASGAGAVVFDVKTGDGAILQDLDEGRRLAQLLVDTATELGTPARGLITDMSQVLGRWAGHSAEVRETLECLEGKGPADLMEVTCRLCEELADLVGQPLSRAQLEAAIGSGAAREHFDRWAAGQGADPAWLAQPELPLAPEEVVLAAERDGVLARVHNRELGLLLVEAGGGRLRPGDRIDFGISLHVRARLGDRVTAGDELARLYLRRRDEHLIARCRACFEVAGEGEAPQLIRERILPRS